MPSGKLDVGAALETLARARPGLWSLSACGVTRSQSSIPALVDRDAYAPGSERVRVLLVSDLSGDRRDVDTSLRVLEHFAGRGDRPAETIGLSAVPCANPDGLDQDIGPENGAGGLADEGYPPEGGFFDHPQHPEKRYLWRWVCFQAPDLVVELRCGGGPVWEVNEAATHLAAGPGRRKAQPNR